VHGTVEHLHVASLAGEPVRRVNTIGAVPGVGLEGDRYALGTGHWSGNSGVSRDLTLVEAEVLDDLEREHGIRLDPGETRRNVTTRGVRLNDLVGERFWVGEVLCEGTRLCEPCTYLQELTGKAILRPLAHRGGLRANVISSGVMRVGDIVEPVQVLPGVGVLLVRDGKLLLGRRLSAHGRGTWSPPGGKPEGDEPVEVCAVRELREETGLAGASARVVGTTLDSFSESRLTYRTTFVLVDAGCGDPHVLEPEKIEAWDWYPWDALPDPLFAPLASLIAGGYAPDSSLSGAPD
jgi:ADP-ribose pyrophosphatase YjhB (NUDIX family)